MDLGLANRHVLITGASRGIGAGLAQVGVQEPTKRVVTGAVIVAAALLDYYRRRTRAA